MRWIMMLCVVLGAGCRGAGPEVRVTLNDGQVVVGRLATEQIALATKGFGELEFDTRDAGELGLVEGDSVTASGNMIRLWLRNGSEFVGQWQKPSIEVLLELGESQSRIDVPIAKLKRLQFKGDAVWPSDAVFRIVTRSGDDFFVDVTKTQLPLESDLGKFTPFLSQIEQLQPIEREKNKWRVTLETGTVFVASLASEQLDLRLAMGPERIQLPLSAVKQMDRQRLDGPQTVGVDYRGLSSGGFGVGSQAERRMAPQAPPHGRAGPVEDSQSGFYSNRAQKAAKQRAAQGWSQQSQER